LFGARQDVFNQIHLVQTRNDAMQSGVVSDQLSACLAQSL
jgi:hypothetical protein